LKIDAIGTSRDRELAETKEKISDKSVANLVANVNERKEGGGHGRKRSKKKKREEANFYKMEIFFLLKSSWKSILMNILPAFHFAIQKCERTHELLL